MIRKQPTVSAQDSQAPGWELQAPGWELLPALLLKAAPPVATGSGCCACMSGTAAGAEEALTRTNPWGGKGPGPFWSPALPADARHDDAAACALLTGREVDDSDSSSRLSPCCRA